MKEKYFTSTGHINVKESQELAQEIRTKFIELSRLLEQAKTEQIQVEFESKFSSDAHGRYPSIALLKKLSYENPYRQRTFTATNYDNSSSNHFYFRTFYSKTMSLTSILKSIGKFIGGLLPFAKNAISVGRDVATEIKEIVDNPLWDVVTSLTSTKLDDVALTALRGYLAALLKDLALCDPAETGFGVILKQASKCIKDMTVPEAKAGTLNTIAAAIATKSAQLNGKVLPIETTLATAQPAYIHPELLEVK